MKTRVGFVSNSSSSSFIVWNWDYLDNKTLLDKKQVKLLEDFGFIPTDTYNLMDVECRTNDELKKKDSSKAPCSYAYGVTCNQEDVIEYLVAHKIPFRALCHYGHWVCLFDGKLIRRIPNFGLQAEMHGVEDLETEYGFEIAEYIKEETRKDYAKQTKRILDMPRKRTRSKGNGSNRSKTGK